MNLRILSTSQSWHYNVKSDLLHPAFLRSVSKLCPLQLVHFTGVLLSPSPDQEGNKLQRQKILIFLYPIYYHNWRNIITIFIYVTRLASNEIFSQSNKIHREVGRVKDLSAPLYTDQCCSCFYLLILLSDLYVCSQWWYREHEELATLEDETMTSRNVKNKVPSDVASYPSRTETAG